MTSDGLIIGFEKFIALTFPRVLTHLDRDPGSPTFGSFDRGFWHYKSQDYASAILQQGLLALEAARAGELDAGVSSEIAESWCLGTLAALNRCIDEKGRVDEFYPAEASFPAGAFALRAACRVLFDWQTRAPRLLEQVDWEPLRRLARHMAARVETEVCNQAAAALAGLALAARLAPLGISPDVARAHADRLFALQHAEGWFPEYGGPDFGYLSVTLDCLFDYFDASGDARAPESARRATAFLARLVGADGRIPFDMGSRNTDYLLPYGLVRVAEHDPAAAGLVRSIFGTLDDPDHFLWAVDDRYMTHYTFASVVRAFPRLARMATPRPPEPAAETWLDGAGYWVRWSADRRRTFYVAARKGGLARIHRADGPPIVDHGWRVDVDGKLWTTNWWSELWRVTKTPGTLTVEGPCQRARFLLPNTWRHAVLRVAARVFRHRLKPWLKRLLIWRPGSDAAPRYIREVRCDGTALDIEDRIVAGRIRSASPAPRANLRHVPSANVFSIDERGARFSWRETSASSGERAFACAWRAADSGS